MLVTNIQYLGEGRIIKYFDVINTHVVVGNNILKDFSASLTDFFGGKSDTYQNQLVELYDEVINSLKLKAEYLGANAILGFSIDIDELAGQGKSMFMISAIGTPVIMKNEDEKFKADKFVTASDLHNLSLVEKYKEVILENKLTLNDSTIDFILKNKMEEALPNLINHFKDLAKDENRVTDYKNFYPKFYRYLVSIDKNYSSKILYESLTDGSKQALTKLTDIMVELNFYDNQYIIELLKDGNLFFKKLGIKLALSKKDFYKKEDVKELYELAILCKNSFQETVNFETKKGLLGKEKQVWLCSCGKQNEIDTEYCNECNKDTYGFLASEIKPNQAFELLNRRAKVLDNVLIE